MNSKIVEFLSTQGCECIREASDGEYRFVYMGDRCRVYDVHTLYDANKALNLLTGRIVHSDENED